MKIRARFNLIFTLLATIALVFFGVTVYWVSKNDREKEFSSILKNKALVKSKLILSANLSLDELQQIFATQNEDSNRVAIAIYNEDFQQVYSEKSIFNTPDSTQIVLQKAKAHNEYIVRDGTKLTMGMTFLNDGKDYLVIASGSDHYGKEKLSELLYILIITAGIAIILLFILGFYFSKRVLNPIKEMTQEINKITAAHLDLRLRPLKHKDELNKLGAIFNQMLDRLESSFDSQKEFVAHISHELRTPLAAIITDLELALNQTHSSEEYRNTIERTLSDAKKIVHLSNNLLDLAKANYDPKEVGYTSLRIDEVLLEAYQEIQQGSAPCTVQMEFVGDTTDEHFMTVVGNPYLLKVACKNIIENACKFSYDHHCYIRIGFTNKMVKIEFIDNGIGIDDEDLDHIFVPFYRGSSQSDYDGYGIGLPLTQKILVQHSGELKVTTSPEQGSTFTMYIPHLANK